MKNQTGTGGSGMSGHKLPGVACDVHGCKYNEVSNCCADSISVENEHAQRKGETYCSTFSPRGGYNAG